MLTRIRCQHTILMICEWEKMLLYPLISSAGLFINNQRVSVAVQIRSRSAGDSVVERKRFTLERDPTLRPLVVPPVINPAPEHASC